ncbi:hypothetical protein KC866_02675 [Patescibacteria group bacterium]|nr:hypothetical protein [Patescibacteria group bacterium]
METINLSIPFPTTAGYPGKQLLKILKEKGHAVGTFVKKNLSKITPTSGKEVRFQIILPTVPSFEDLSETERCLNSSVGLSYEDAALLRCTITNSQLEEIGVRGLLFNLKEGGIGYIGSPISYGPHNYSSDSLLNFDVTLFVPPEEKVNYGCLSAVA